ncbi:hypothetical protein D3C77_294380 [compost metagenome]
MRAEGAANKRLLRGLHRIGGIAKTPLPAVNWIHERLLARNDTDWQTASHHLAVNDQIRLHAEPSLSPA